MNRSHFEVFPELAGAGIRLRRVVADDASSIREITFYDGIGAATVEEAAAMIQRIDQDYAKGNTLHWGICLSDDDEIVGTCGYYRGFPADTGEIGYVLQESCRGQGIMNRALKLIVEFGFTELDLAQIVAYTDRRNAASIAVLERLGFDLADARDETLKYERVVP
jgi:[ribosomal protein S5]-alanine N-acetyltransferase